MYQVEGAHWWFAGRRRIIAGFVERIAGTQVNCGRGFWMLDVAPAQIYKCWVSSAPPRELTCPRKRWFCRTRGLAQVKQGAAEETPFADASFDLVTGLDVVEHLDDDIAGLSEMRRNCSGQTALAVLFVPAFMFLWGSAG